MPRRVSLFPFYLIQNRTDFSVPVQSNSHAKLCNRPRKALHLPTQSFASAHAKLCICPRKALHPPTQSFASANAKHCLHLGVPSPCFFNRAVIYDFALTARPSPTWNNPGCRYALPWAMCFCALPFLCLSFAFPLPFLAAGDLWFSATIIDMNFRIRIFNFCTSNCTPYLLIRQGGRVT